MTQTKTLKKLRRSHWRTLERLLKQAWQDGHGAGLAQAHGRRRQGRTIRADATIDGLVRRIERHFGLGAYGFEVRIVHAESGRRVPAAHPLSRYRVED